MSTESPNKRILSGMRATSPRLHLGNYEGALRNWVALQNDGFEMFCMVADWHALTTMHKDVTQVGRNSREVAKDYVAAGIDPSKSVVFVQSHVKEHAELHLLFSMLTPLGWLERVPTYKDQQEQLKEKDLSTYGFLGYPLLQSADILLYQPKFVPVGQDQVAHIELTREVARRFNQLYRSRSTVAVLEAESDKERIVAEVSQNEVSEQILPEPQVLLTPSPKLPGTDGRKMSKSYGNTILLSDPEPEIRAKLKPMVTDPARIRRSDPGNPDVCPVFDLHKVFSSEPVQQEARIGCTTAGIGCIQCKTWLADGVVAALAPIQERRRHYESHPDEVAAIFEDGSQRARARAAQTMTQVRSAMGLE